MSKVNEPLCMSYVNEDIYMNPSEWTHVDEPMTTKSQWVTSHDDECKVLGEEAW